MCREHLLLDVVEAEFKRKECTVQKKYTKLFNFPKPHIQSSLLCCIAFPNALLTLVVVTQESESYAKFLCWTQT